MVITADELVSPQRESVQEDGVKQFVFICSGFPNTVVFVEFWIHLVVETGQTERKRRLKFKRSIQAGDNPG